MIVKEANKQAMVYFATGSRRCASFVLYSMTMHELHIYSACIG